MYGENRRIFGKNFAYPKLFRTVSLPYINQTSFTIGRTKSGSPRFRITCCSLVGLKIYIPRLQFQRLMDWILSGTKLEFLFPFPPASPAYRRNWSLLSRLMPIDAPSNVHRLHGMDAFEVCDRIVSWAEESSIEVVALGPKPHALGAAMAYIKLNGAIELTYAQPQSYDHRYSSEIGLDSDGQPGILGYCLKRHGVRCF